MKEKHVPTVTSLEYKCQQWEDNKGKGGVRSVLQKERRCGKGQGTKGGMWANSAICSYMQIQLYGVKTTYYNLVYAFYSLNCSHRESLSWDSRAQGEAI